MRGFETVAWNALFGPKNLPRAIVDRIVPELQRIGELPEIVARVKTIGGQVICSPPEALAARVRSDVAKWRDLARRADIRVE
jgi:tripartite-type tricarboxylate transporter receptor subunit TctC